MKSREEYLRAKATWLRANPERVRRLMELIQNKKSRLSEDNNSIIYFTKTLVPSTKNNDNFEVAGTKKELQARGCLLF